MEIGMLFAKGSEPRENSVSNNFKQKRWIWDRALFWKYVTIKF